MNIAIIGAGPIGCYAGYLFAQAGHSVTIYENHPKIGLPIQCTGLLTHDFDQFGLPTESFLVNTLTRIKVHSLSHSTEIEQREYLVCRIKFDNFFGNLARNAGATIYLSHSFTRKEGEELVIKDSKNEVEVRIKPDLVIAADGPLSPTAKAYGFYHPERVNYYGIQATVEGQFDPDTYEAHFGEEVCPGLFAWIVPESKTTARVGVATLKDSRRYFDRFMKEKGFKATAIQAGTIPVYSPLQELSRENCYVLGDAAGFVKATTLGGLIPGLMQTRILVDCLTSGKNYSNEIAPLRRRLRMHLRMHTMFERFKDKDWDRLVGYMNQPRIQKVLAQHTRENPFPILVKSLVQEPRFAYFAKFLV